MKKKLSKTETKKQIEEVFNHIKEKTQKDVEKIKKLAMKHNIKLGIKKRLYCTKCLHPYIEPEIRIKSGFVNMKCEFCNHTARWKLHMKDLDEEIIPISDEENECGC